jgi:hypothetical protein
MLNTLVYNQPVNKGSQWAVFVPTLRISELVVMSGLIEN